MNQDQWREAGRAWEEGRREAHVANMLPQLALAAGMLLIMAMAAVAMLLAWLFR